jgi:hypothetical protein
MNALPGLGGLLWHAEAENKKSRRKAASKSLIREAGHGIRTRDFDLGKFVVN